MGRVNKLSRRDFLKIAGLNLSGVAFRNFLGISNWVEGWPSLAYRNLPPAVLDIIKRVPKSEMMRNGRLQLLSERGYSLGRVPLARTDWNLERDHQVDELFQDLRWGIVLHWYGDHEYYDKTIKGFLRGFNSVRHIEDYKTRTSAHFLVGDHVPSVRINPEEDFFGILQTQAASPIGIPYLASHLNNYEIRSYDGDHYLVNALYKLGLANVSTDPVLKNIFEGPKVDPNFRTIAVEIAGSDFDNSGSYPSNQKIANVLSVVWAIMKRYGIRAIDVLGHNEVQLSNSDPGKKFMALIRYLIGVMALLERDARMCYKVFGPFLDQDRIPANAVHRYFKYVRDFLVLVGLPKTVYEWEVWSKYWFLFDKITEQPTSTIVMKESHPPLVADATNPGNWYLDPENHEGIDIYLADNRNQMVRNSSPAFLISNGRCVFIGENRGFHHGKMAIFRHRQPDGAELLTVYGHLDDIGNVEIGKSYPAGFRLGTIGGLEDGTYSFLHFSTAYGATWDSHLQHNPNVPLSANEKWVQRHYLDPEKILQENSF